MASTTSSRSGGSITLIPTSTCRRTRRRRSRAGRRTPSPAAAPERREATHPTPARPVHGAGLFLRSPPPRQLLRRVDRGVREPPPFFFRGRPDAAQPRLVVEEPPQLFRQFGVSRRPLLA